MQHLEQRRITDDLQLCNCATEHHLFTISLSYSYKSSPTLSSPYGFHPLCHSQKITITITIIPMTISSWGAEAAAGSVIKRQSVGKAETNSGLQSGGPRECEKVNTESGTLHRRTFRQMRLEVESLAALSLFTLSTCEHPHWQTFTLNTSLLLQTGCCQLLNKLQGLQVVKIEGWGEPIFMAKKSKSAERKVMK